MAETYQQSVKCPECQTDLGGDSGRDVYKHMLHCLHVEPDNLERIRERALEAKNENGRRVAFLVDSLLSKPTLGPDF